MMKVFTSILSLAALCWAPVATAQATLTPSADTLLGSGPTQSVMEMEATLPGQTVYRPADLTAFSARSLPVVLWGNGACANQGNAFRAFLSEIASYGYVIIALGPIDPEASLYEPQNVPTTTVAPPIAAPRINGARPPGAGAMPPPRTRTAQMIEALDWIQSAQASARYGDKLNTDAVAVMGMSCGGAQAIEAAADPRIRTAMIWNSGLFPDGTDMGGGALMTKSNLTQMNGPIAYISGDATDIAFNNANDDYDRLSAAGHSVFRAWERGVGHGGNYGRPNGGEFAGIAIAWLNWHLKHDDQAAGMFRGPSCGLCVNPRWVVRSNNLH